MKGDLTAQQLLDAKSQKFDVVAHPEEIRASLAKLKDTFAIDIEATGLDLYEAKVLCVGLSDGNHTLVIYPWDKGVHAPILSEFFLSAATASVGTHNGYNYDHIILRRDGVEVPDAKIDDTLIAHHTFASHFPQRLAHVASVFCDTGPWKITSKAKKGGGAEEKGLAPAEMDPEALVYYNACDARIQARVWLAMQADLASELKVYAHDKEIAQTICQPMLIRGIYRDPVRTGELGDIIEAKKARLVGEMRALLRYKGFTPSKHAHVRRALFSTLKAPMLYPTESGLPSTASATLEELKKAKTRAGRLASFILQWRSADKVKGTYLDKIEVDAEHRFHPNWKSYGTVSGRLSSRLQSVPRKEVDKDLLHPARRRVSRREPVGDQRRGEQGRRQKSRRRGDEGPRSLRSARRVQTSILRPRPKRDEGSCLFIRRW